MHHESVHQAPALRQEAEPAVHDRELLGLAALAAGYVIESFASDGGCWAYVPGSRPNGDGEPPLFKWHPLADNGQALELAVKLRLDMYHYDSTSCGSDFDYIDVVHMDGRDNGFASEDLGGDACAQTRRAIVRAAADRAAVDRDGF